jgi:mannitol/fructose-specific phosphotransferase system IIA component (Ntr-type)
VKSLQQAFSSDQTCLLDVSANSMESLIPVVIDRLIENGLLPADQRDEVIETFVAREHVVSTAIGHSVAVPHCYLDGLTEPLIAFVRLEHAVNLGALDGTPTRYFFFLLGPTGRAAEHLDTLALIARLMSDDELRYDLGDAADAEALRWALGRAAERSRPQQQREQVSDGLAYTGRLCGGLRADIARRLPHYVRDFRDGLHPQSLASTLFLYFACLAPAVIFGGLMSAETGNSIGAVEMILATAVCGIIYSLFAGQPLIILGGTGPLLVFTAILYDLCQPDKLDIPFLPAYAWVGFWTAAFVVILAITDSSCLMRFFTRFTDEVFAALISLIFIYKAVWSLADEFRGLDAHDHHDTALLTLLLALGTFYIAISLQRFRRSRYLLPWMREFLSDFGPTIALIAMTLVAIWLHGVDLQQLDVPESVRPTLATRDSWLINPFDAPPWVWFAAAGPALLATVLVFLDQNITARLVNSRDHKLQKGEAYHLDLAVVGGLIGLCSAFGLPWLVAATVRSLNHVRSLAVVEESVSNRDNQRHDHILHTRENRLTGLAIHILIALSLLLLPLLKHVPMAVLYGLFLFMGVVSMKGNQLFERLSLWAMDSSLYPGTHYIRRVPNRTIHLFTVLQLVCLVVLWVVKGNGTIGILFPLFIAALVPVRLLMNRYFKEEHLQALDAEEIPEEEETQW